MSTVPTLEERYRRLLRALPEPARSRWADEMTETYLEATCADDPEFAEFGSPDLADRLDVWRLALRLRLGGPGASARAVLTGAVVRRVALLGALVPAAEAALGVAATTIARALEPELPWVTTWWTPVATVAAVFAVVLFGCLVHGSSAARPVAGVLLAVLGVGLLSQPAPGPPLLTVLGGALVGALPLLAAVVTPPSRARRPGRWWAGAAGAVALVVVLPLVSTALPFVWTTQAAGAVVLALAAIGATLVGAVPTAGAAAVLALLWLPLVLSSALVGGGPAGYAAGQAAAAALLVLAATAGGVSTAQAARQLPAPTT